MSKATIVHHQGFGDLFSNNSLVNFFSGYYEELIVLVLDDSRKKIIDSMFKNKKNITCVVPKFIEKNLYNSSCLICMTPGNSNFCPRDERKKCKYIDYSEYLQYNNIKIGSFKENYNKWDFFLNENRKLGKSFAHCFYSYENLEESKRISYFNINRNYALEHDEYEELNTDDYIVLHDDKENNMEIDMSNLNLPIIQLNNSSDFFLDKIKILENAKEIHLIDSSWSVFIYFLSFINDKIKSTPKYLHCYLRKNRDLNIYTDPIPENWFFKK